MIDDNWVVPVRFSDSISERLEKKLTSKENWNVVADVRYRVLFGFAW